MPTPAGYSLDQLLSWCLEDRLIDSFERQGSGVIIVQGELRREFAAGEAEVFLKAAIRPIPKRSEGLPAMTRPEHVGTHVMNRA